MTVQIDNIGLTMVCSRYKPKTTTRTFKGSCGSYTKIIQGADKAILSVKNMHNSCKLSCEICKELTASAKKLLENGK